jgi:hypothetical protein
MPRFFNARDLNFIKTIAEEVVDYVSETTIVLFKMSVGESKTNLYGESLGKVWHAPAPLMALIDRQSKVVRYEGFGPDNTQAVEFRFMRERLRTHKLPILRDVNGTPLPVGAIQNEIYGYPEIGDVILFDGDYYEIDNVVENLLVGGSPQIYNQENGEFVDANMTLTAVAFKVRRSQVQIEDRVR